MCLYQFYINIYASFVQSFHDVFLWVIPFSVLLCITALFLREIQLKSHTREVAEGEGLEDIKEELNV